MREHDDIQHYAPLLRRIFIVVAVVTAVPVMMWTATAFMHRYVMKPEMPWMHTMAAPQASSGSEAAAAVAAAAPNVSPVQAAAPVIEASAAPTNTRGIDTNPKPGPDGNGAAAAAVPIEPAAPAPAASSALPATATMSVVATASDPAPDPMASVGVSQIAAPPPAASDDTTTASLPAAMPLLGPIPLPRHRPSVFALAETGAVPLPRARPGNSPETAPASAEFQSGYDPAMAHY
jgi:hypothetical protein